MTSTILPAPARLSSTCVRKLEVQGESSGDESAGDIGKSTNESRDSENRSESMISKADEVDKNSDGNGEEIGGGDDDDDENGDGDDERGVDDNKKCGGDGDENEDENYEDLGGDDQNENWCDDDEENSRAENISLGQGDAPEDYEGDGHEGYGGDDMDYEWDEDDIQDGGETGDDENRNRADFTEANQPGGGESAIAGEKPSISSGGDRSHRDNFLGRDDLSGKGRSYDQNRFFSANLSTCGGHMCQNQSSSLAHGFDRHHDMSERGRGSNIQMNDPQGQIIPLDQNSVLNQYRNTPQLSKCYCEHADSSESRDSKIYKRSASHSTARTPA